MEEVKGPIDPHEMDLVGRGTPDSIHARRIWQGPSLLKLVSGEEVKVHSGEWIVSIAYNTFENYEEDGVEKTREIFKTVTVPMPDDCVRSLFGHLFPEEAVNIDSLSEVASNETSDSGGQGGPGLLVETGKSTSGDAPKTAEQIKALQEAELKEFGINPQEL